MKEWAFRSAHSTQVPVHARFLQCWWPGVDRWRKPYPCGAAVGKGSQQHRTQDRLASAPSVTLLLGTGRRPGAAISSPLRRSQRSAE